MNLAYRVRNYYRIIHNTRWMMLNRGGSWFWQYSNSSGYWRSVSQFGTKDTQITRQRKVSMEYYKLKNGRRMRIIPHYQYPLCKYGVII